MYKRANDGRLLKRDREGESCAKEKATIMSTELSGRGTAGVFGGIFVFAKHEVVKKYEPMQLYFVFCFMAGGVRHGRKKMNRPIPSRKKKRMSIDALLITLLFKKHCLCRA